MNTIYTWVSHHSLPAVYLLITAQLAMLGHRLGDFMFQSKTMALRKSRYSHPGWDGFGWCTLHVTIYSICVCACWLTYDPLIFAAIFIPHWLIDRYSLGELWLILIRGRTYKDAQQDGCIGSAFYALVYQKVDETLHYLCLAAVILLLRQFMIFGGSHEISAYLGSLSR